MPANSHLIEYDDLSIKLLSALAGNALDNISTSAGKMLDVACLFFDKDVSESLLSFHKLYLENGHLDEHKDNINQQADEIFEAAKSSNIDSKINFDVESQKKITELANVQKELEALIQQDNHIKERMVPVMQCMQYEDLISNRIHRLILCWEYMVVLLRKPNDLNVTEALDTFNGYLASEDEHAKFFECVLKCDYDQQNVADVVHDIVDINGLLERLFDFSHASLNECISQTQQAFDELIVLLNLVTGESSDVAYLFLDKSETLTDIKNIITKSQDSNKDNKAGELIQEIADTRTKHSKEATGLIQSFMMALQSQDIIRQNIENIGHVHHIWSSYRKVIKASKKLSPNYLIDFGQDLISKMTSHPEQVIVEGFIPGVEAGSDDDDGVFF